VSADGEFLIYWLFQGGPSFFQSSSIDVQEKMSHKNIAKQMILNLEEIPSQSLLVLLSLFALQL